MIADRSLRSRMAARPSRTCSACARAARATRRPSSSRATAKSCITYGELDARARATAAALQAACTPGRRPRAPPVPPGPRLTSPPSSGCFYAGAVAVPAYPPDPYRLERTLPRLAATLRSARVDAVLTTAAIRPLLEQHLAGAAGGMLPASVLATPPGALPEPEGRRPPSPVPEELALLQYTSGSTAAPQGRDAHAPQPRRTTQRSSATRSATRAASRAVSWLPPYHDMGLIGGVLQPVFAGFPCVLMSPLDVPAHPARWLAGDHALPGDGERRPELRLRPVRPAHLARAAHGGSTCGRWDVAFNGAEPVRS